MEYAYNGFNEPTQQANVDRITQILQSKAPAPQQDPQAEFANAIAAFQQQNGVSQGQNQRYAQMGQPDKITQIKQAEAAGHPQALALDKVATKLIGNDEVVKDSFKTFVADQPNAIDPSNSYQTMTAFAQWSRQSGYSQQATQRQALSPQQISMQDMASIASGKGTDYFGKQRADEKALADLAASEALSIKSTRGGSIPASIQIANEIEAARQAGDMQRVADLERVHKMVKLGEGMTIGADQQVAELPGYGSVSGGIKEQEKFGTERGGKLGANVGEKEVLIGQMGARIPQLIDVTQRLSQAGKKATYTTAGRLWNRARLETGFDPREEATARTEYVSIVDNEVLPLLRETFGAQFTQKEGESLKVTLGDPDLQPQQKDAVLRSFMTSKMGTINSIARELGRPDVFTRQDIQDILSQINISQPPSGGAPFTGGVKFLGFE